MEWTPSLNKDGLPIQAAALSFVKPIVIKHRSGTPSAVLVSLWLCCWISNLVGSQSAPIGTLPLLVFRDENQRDSSTPTGVPVRRRNTCRPRVIVDPGMRRSLLHGNLNTVVLPITVALSERSDGRRMRTGRADDPASQARWPPA